jgi:biofilm PGA synthesis N-glycosyltransferase PgaC
MEVSKTKSYTKSEKKDLYISVKAKFFMSLILALLWVVFSIYLSLPWINELASVTNIFIAFFIIGGIAYVPGFMNAFLISSLLFDKQPKFKNSNPTEEITILVAAYNEEVGIFDTLQYIKKQDYKGKINTIVINNNSSDNTVSEVLRATEILNMDIECIDEPNPSQIPLLTLHRRGDSRRWSMKSALRRLRSY